MLWLMQQVRLMKRLTAQRKGERLMLMLEEGRRGKTMDDVRSDRRCGERGGEAGGAG